MDSQNNNNNFFIQITLIILFIVLIFIPVISFICYKKKEKRQLTIQEEREKLSSQYFGDTYRHCKGIDMSNSSGVLVDSSIVCHITKDLPSTPFFYYESYPSGGFKNAWFFPNLDMTNFEQVKSDKNSPYNLLCKTKQTYEILKTNFPEKNVVYTGFTSLDKYDDTIEKDYKGFIHVAGKSPFKGTIYLIEYWLKNPQWPTLIIVCRFSLGDMCKNMLIGKNCKNIKLIVGYIPEKELTSLMNKNAIHICCSKHEGFGHYLNEARALKSIILYTDAPPMNEFFVNGVDGIGIEAEYIGTTNNGYCPMYKITKTGLENAVNKVLNMQNEELIKIGNNTRNSFLKNHSEFQDRLIKMIKGDNVIPKNIHFVWIDKNDNYKDVDLPQKNKKYIESWKENNPDFNIRVWSGKSILKLISDNLPEFLEFYIDIPKTISKCDFARFAIVYVYGGVYSDADFFCRKNVSSLLTTESYFISEPLDASWKTFTMCNGFFASYAKNNLLYDWLAYMYDTKNKYNWDVMETTGPYNLTRYMKQTTNTLLMGNMCKILSITHKGDTDNSCKGIYNNFTTTIWDDGASWWDDYSDQHKDIFSKKGGKFMYVNNPNDDTKLIWQKDKLTPKKSPLFDQYKSSKQNSIIVINNAKHGQEAIPLAIALKNINRKDIIVKVYDREEENCDFIEKMALMNRIPNIEVNKGFSKDNELHESFMKYQNQYSIRVLDCENKSQK